MQPMGLGVEKPGENEAATPCLGVYALLLVPLALFLFSFLIPPAMVFDTAKGFIVLRSMLAGGPFNYEPSPDPANIAHSVLTYLTWWSPGQYLVPGIFVRLGADDGLAISLTTLIAALIGLVGWIRVARSFHVSCFVMTLFVIGLTTFRYAEYNFRFFDGGEALVFAAYPWTLIALRWAIERPPIFAFAVTLATAIGIFFAKLSGLFAFAATVSAIGVLSIVQRRRIAPWIFAMGAASAIAALLLLLFWTGRGQTPLSSASYGFNWPVIFFPIAAATFSGFSLHELADWLLLRPSAPLLSNLGDTSYVLGPIALLLMIWAWIQLRKTRYRPMAILLLTIVAFYSAAFIALYLRSVSHTSVPFEERYFRYAGILSFLLLLIAADQWRNKFARAITVLLVAGFSTYGLASYTSGLRALRGHYDAASGTSMIRVPQAVLVYLRSQMASHQWQNAVVVVPELEAANGLPNYRILFSFELLDDIPAQEITQQRWAGRVDKLFVMMEPQMRDDGKADIVLKTFLDYDFNKWDRKEIGNMLLYSQ